uniref:Calcium channel, voltage-dependent, L type, alpha 1D subunit, b n=1 Tax=Echeneis naucrates TaxID=173247 RepID=A0A665X6C6_ECHNA
MLLDDSASLVQTQVKQKELAGIRKPILPAKNVNGKECRGSPFISKPEVVLFKDFEVGKLYKKKIVLTNSSYTTNHCKLLGVSAQLKNFICISFQPPGSLSAGMSCDMQVIFQPMNNDDLEGEVQFASAVGFFSVPVKCTTKKCDLEVDSQLIDFGAHVVGQTVSRTITLTNKGALGTLFSLDLATVLSQDTNHLQMPSQNSIHTYQVREGEIGPFESIKLEVVFTPTVPGEAILDFHIEFSNKSIKPVRHTMGIAVCIPVWVVQPNIDLKICMFDCLYQNSIMVQTSTALKVTFEVGPELRKHIEILPKTGFIQAQSRFNAQLKFLPRHSLSKDAKKFFDNDTGVLEVPMTVQVAGQVSPVHFTVQAVVTSSDLQFDCTEVDFGYCSIYQLVKKSVRLTNSSLLPQDFGFVDVPEVQPNDGFGTLLPQETLEIDLIFSANKAKEFNFQLSCKSGINRDFLLFCRAVGVRPPLELSHSFIHFGATAIGDNSTAILYLHYHHTNRNQSKQPVTPVTKDAMAPAPRLFSFTLPKDSDISITPSAGRLLAGERCLVQVMHRPRLTEQEIQEEALRLLHQSKMLHEKEFHCHCCFITCHLQCFLSPFNTLYLKLHCAAVQPALVIISNNGNSMIEFNQVAVGEFFTYCKCSLLRSSVLDIHGPFHLINALRCISPGEKHTVVLAFSPKQEKTYCETLHILTQQMTLEVTLCGKGVVPAVTSSHPGGLLDFGYVLEKESTSELQNSSTVAVGFRVLLAGLSPFWPQAGADRVPSLLGIYTDCQPQPTVGTQNYSGLSVFSVVPVEGSIAPGHSQEITVTFQPDHPSVNYSGKLTIELMNKRKVCAMDLKGAASSHNMYLHGGDMLTVPIESLLPSLITSQTQLTGKKSPHVSLFSLYSWYYGN